MAQEYEYGFLPQDEGYPYSTLLGRGSDQSGIRRVFDIGREAQFMTPELVDLQMRYIEEQKRLLRQYGLLNDVY